MEQIIETSLAPVVETFFRGEIIMQDSESTVPVGQYFIEQNGAICTWLPSPDGKSGAWAPVPIDPYVVLSELQMERHQISEAITDLLTALKLLEGGEPIVAPKLAEKASQE